MTCEKDFNANLSKYSTCLREAQCLCESDKNGASLKQKDCDMVEFN